MNANRVRPLAAYGLVSLACAAVMIQGMQPSTVDDVLGAESGPTAAPVSAAATVPGAVLRARTTGPGIVPAADLPTPTLPGRSIGPVGTTTTGSASEATYSDTDRPSGPTVTFHQSLPPDRPTSAGSAGIDGSGAEGKQAAGKPGKGEGKGRGTGKPKGKTHAGRPDTSAGIGKGAQDIRA